MKGLEVVEPQGVDVFCRSLLPLHNLQIDSFVGLRGLYNVWKLAPIQKQEIEAFARINVTPTLWSRKKPIRDTPLHLWHHVNAFTRLST